MQEKKLVEDYLVEQVAKRGGEAVKCEVPGQRGWPDRKVLSFPGRIFYVECKRPGKTSGAMQRIRHRHLRALGFRVYVAASRAAVDRILRKELPKK